jgi:hypothetical protein
VIGSVHRRIEGKRPVVVVDGDLGVAAEGV